VSVLFKEKKDGFMQKPFFVSDIQYKFIDFAQNIFTQTIYNCKVL
jgi:hypothetical protein